MANFKPDMSWRDDERVQRVTEQPSGGAHERTAETPDVRVNMRPNGQATEQSAGQAQQMPGRSTSRIPRPARQPNGQAAERANEAVSRLGGVRALVVLAAVLVCGAGGASPRVVIGAVAAFAVIGGVGDVQGAGEASSSASKESSSTDASGSKTKKEKGLVDVDAITDDTLHGLLADYDNDDDGQLTAKETQRITELVVSDEVTDFTPISKLDKLDTLGINTLSAKSADFSELEALEVLKFGDMTTQDLDLSVCPKLNSFKIEGLKGAVSSINASGLKNLMFFTVDQGLQGDVEKIDLSNDDILGALEITCNVGELNLSGCSHSFPKLNIAADHIDKIVVDSNTNADLVATLRDLCAQKGWTLEER